MPWVVLVGNVEEARAATSRRREKCLQRRRERAKSCGLQWLRSNHKKIGKQSRVDKRFTFPYVLSEHDCEDLLEAEAITKTPSAWWRPGLPLSRPELGAEQLKVIVLFSDSTVTAYSPVDEGSPVEPWIYFIDGASIHISI